MAYLPRKSFGTAIALVVAALLGSGSARADATFRFAVSGQFDEQDGSGDVLYPWTGQLTVVLDSGADGTYGNADLVSFDMVSTNVDFVEPSVTPIPFIADFTVADGQLTSIDAVYYDPVFPIVVTSFGGLTVSYDQPLIYFSPPTVGTAVLTPMPEPGAWAMLLFGLALAAVGSRIHGRRLGVA